MISPESSSTLEIPEVTPLSPLITRSPRTPRKGIERQRSNTDLRISVSKKWDLSPHVRRNSVIFSSNLPEETVEPEKKTSLENSNELKAVEQEKEPSQTLEDRSRESILKEAYADEKSGWFLIGSREGVWIYRKKCEGTTDAFKTICVVDVSPNQFMQVLKELTLHKNWDPWIDQCRVIEMVDDHCNINYISYLGTPNAEKRDYCVLSAWGKTVNDIQVLSSISVEHKDVPPVEGTIRGQILMSGYVVKPVVANENQSVVVQVAQYDPKGSDLNDAQRSSIAIQNGMVIHEIERIA